MSSNNTIRFLALALVVILWAPLGQASAGWLRTGLWGDCCRDIEFDSSNSHLIYGVGWNGAVYRSQDGGIHWTESRLGLRSDLIPASFVNLRVHPLTGHLFYWAGSVLFRSTDQGQTWNLILRTDHGCRSKLDPDSISCERSCF